MRYLLAVFLCASALAQAVPESWIDSPEAYFATSDERREWAALPDRPQRDAFKTRYWLRRDPSPGTARNEFQETVLGRIKTADSRFGIGKTPGSATQRGKVFVVLGSPARAKELYAPRPDAPPPPGAPPSRSQVGMVEGNEVTHAWSWDRERTPRLMEALNRPTLEVVIVLEPSKRRDRLQNPGLFNEIQQIIAEKSISNRELVSGTTSSPQRSAPAVTNLAEGTLAEETQKRIALSSENPETELRHSVLFDRDGGVNLLVSATLPEKQTIESPSILVEMTSKSVSYSAIAAAQKTTDFLSSTPAATYTAVFRLPQSTGSAQVSFANGTRILKSRKIEVDGTYAFTISTPILSGGASATDVTSNPLLQFGPHVIRPRVGGTSFSPFESVWYFFQVKGRTPPKLELHVQLRGSDGKVRSADPFRVELARHSDQVHFSGYELPLTDLPAGTYSLYLTFRDLDTNQSIARRADFQIRAE